MTRTRMGLVPGLLLALAVTGCGGGDNGDGVASLGGANQATSTTAGGGQQELAFARCMRQHGINLPDPQITAEGLNQPSAPGVPKDDPRATAAERACAQRGGGGK